MNKQKTGCLRYRQSDGTYKVLASDKPFSHLQALKKEYIQRGWDKEKFKLTY